MTEGGDLDKLGRGCVWHNEVQNCLHQNHIFAVRPFQGMLCPDFLAALLSSRHGREYFQITGKQTTNLASTNSTTLKAFPVFLPDPQEQEKILRFIARESVSVDSAIQQAQRKV